MAKGIRTTLMCFLLCSSMAAVSLMPTFAADIRLGSILPGGGIIHKKITSMRETRYRDLVKQNTDYSCGAAAVATILKYAYGKDVTEEEVLRDMIKVSDPKVVRKTGFSLLDIKNYLETDGLRGRGYQLTVEQLTRVKVPTIVLIDTDGYKHFVVLKKATKNKVYLADSALGNKVMSKKDFAVAWNGIVFAVIGKGYNKNTILRTSARPLGVKRYALKPPVWDAKVYDFGFAHANLF